MCESWALDVVTSAKVQLCGCTIDKSLVHKLGPTYGLIVFSLNKCVSLTFKSRALDIVSKYKVTIMLDLFMIKSLVSKVWLLSNSYIVFNLVDVVSI